jgi:ubiquinone/menaquinone biosynthesis C-methylase UbiE
MKKNNKCILCKKKLLDIPYLVFNNINKKINGKFEICFNCKIESKKNKVNVNNLYFRRETTNFNINNILLLFFKSFFLKLYFLNVIGKISENIKILDFGTGSGELANALFKQKYKKIFATDIANNRPLNLNSNIKYYSLKIIKKKKFDIVIARHTLEHIKKINNTINFLKKIIRKNGTLIIEIPNFDSIWKKIMKSYWPGYFYPFHEYVFSKESIKILLENNGLKKYLIKKTDYPIFGNFFYSLKFNLKVSKLLSILFFPIQLLITKIFQTSESIIIIVKNE